MSNHIKNNDAHLYIIEIIKKLFEFPDVESAMHKNFEDLDIDSLGFLELIGEVEEYFDLELSDAEVDLIKTGDDLVRAINRAIHLKNSAIAQ